MSCIVVMIAGIVGSDGLLLLSVRLPQSFLGNLDFYLLLHTRRPQGHLKARDTSNYVKGTDALFSLTF